MLSADVVVAGGGVSGLLIASALAPECSVLLLEQCDSLPRNKYWLTDEKSASKNPHLQSCIDRRYDFLDFIAYDNLSATIRGSYCLWDTDKLVRQLERELAKCGVSIHTGHKLYSISTKRDGITIRANSLAINAKLLIDCMGFGSPLVGAKDVATIIGYYLLHGCEVGIKKQIRPIGLDNVLINQRPAYFELFPTSHDTAHASIILPSRHHTPDRSIKGELNFILGKSHYSDQVIWDPSRTQKSYFGIIPVGRLRRPALDRIIFFGEAGQTNPATSATGLTRMLHTYRELANGIVNCLKQNRLLQEHLLTAMPLYMTHLNRRFQESIFEALLSFNSDDFRRLILDLREYPDDVINDLVFADFDFRTRKATRLFFDALLRSRGILGSHIIKSLFRYYSRKG